MTQPQLEARKLRLKLKKLTAEGSAKRIAAICAEINAQSKIIELRPA